MRLHTALLALASIAITAGQASAQTQVQVKLTAPSVPGGTAVAWSAPGYGAFYVSPYSGVLLSSNNQSVVLNCVDFFHEVSLNEVWWTNKTVLSSGNLTNTRFNNLQWYLQAAWLTTQYSSPNPGSTPQRTIAIQTAIWNIMTPSAPDKTDGTGTTSQSYWMTQSLANWQTVDAGKFYVLTPTNKNDPTSNQEFLVYDPNAVTAVPEPATLTLMGTGVMFLVGAARRRRARLRATASV